MKKSILIIGGSVLLLTAAFIPAVAEITGQKNYNTISESATSTQQIQTTEMPKSADAQLSSENATETEPAKEATRQPEVKTVTEKKTVAIAYTTTYRNDSSMASGSTKTTTAGANGQKEEYYEVTYTDGAETSRKLVKTTVTKQPVNAVIVRGTAQCTNGTYVNTAGNMVCRPSKTNTGGATAICKDGTYSYSQSRRGTCSHHGGVRKWL